MARTAILLLVCGFTRLPALAQQSKSLQTPEDAFTTRELIAWSHLQAPQPTPEPLPPREGQVPQPAQPQDQQPSSPADPHTQQEPVHAFTGIILKDSSRYLLLGNTTTYQLDVHDQIRAYENRTVKILGSLDAGAQSIKVLRIDPLK